MADGVVQGKLVGVVDGPALLVDVRGQEQQYPLGVDISMAWIGENMEKPITVMVRGGKVTEIA